MRRRTRCRDNAFAESWFSGLKSERIRKRACRACDLVQAGVTDCIKGVADGLRRHTDVGGVLFLDKATMRGSTWSARLDEVQGQDRLDHSRDFMP